MENLWKLEGIPAYVGGELNPVLYNCGSGMKADFYGPTDEDSFMHIVTKTTEEEFCAYCGSLEEKGFEKVFENRNVSGIFLQFKGEKNLYVYYIFNENTARIIWDNSGVLLCDFASKEGTAVHDDTALMQFGLLYSDMIKKVTCDCGMLYAVRLRDNRVIVVDGGEIEQATEPATDEFMARLCDLTGNPEKIVIAAWFCTHPHDDHMDFFCRMLAKFGDKLFVERAMFNFASESLVGSDFNESVQSRIKTTERIKANNPEVKYLKLHTGQKFDLCGAEVEVLLTHEDMLSRHAPRAYEGMNETSTILKLSFDGKSVIFLGDAHVSNGNVLIGRYPEGSVSCDFLQVAHHCINNVENIYAFIKTEYMLIPEGRYLLLKFIYDHYRIVARYCGYDKAMVAGDATQIFRVKDGKLLKTEFFPVCGCSYDGSER